MDRPCKEQTGEVSNSRKALTLKNLDPVFRQTPPHAFQIAARADEIEKELQKGTKKPFSRIERPYIGDAHAAGQKPITFIRQVVALCTYPLLLDSEDFPSDAKDRARRILSGCGGGSIGAYSGYHGIGIIRRDVATYIAKRDGGIPCDFNNIVVSGSGAKGAIQKIIKLLSSTDMKTGALVPIPQHPLYEASLRDINGYMIPYYLNESDDWSIDVDELRRAVNESRNKCVPRAIVVINPGNPAGYVLSRESIQDIIKFAYEERLLILADEVYQMNVYEDGHHFVSFRKVLLEMAHPYNKVELASFFSVSKGYMGECGFRCGYCELLNFDPIVQNHFYDYNNMSSPAVSGQAVLECAVNPPGPGEPSHGLWKKEKDSVLGAIKLKARLIHERMSSIEGMDCKQIIGGMFAFPRIHLSPKAISAAKAEGEVPDVFYCQQLLEETGILVQPGIDYGQKPGTYHFRMSILSAMEDLPGILDRLKQFHQNFSARYA